MVALLVISIVVIAIVFYAIRDYIKEHPKRAIAIILVVLILLAGGAFAWKYVGPALDKYLTHTVDQSINGEVDKGSADGQNADSEDADSQEADSKKADGQEADSKTDKKSKKRDRKSK